MLSTYTMPWSQIDTTGEHPNCHHRLNFFETASFENLKSENMKYELGSTIRTSNEPQEELSTTNIFGITETTMIMKATLINTLLCLLFLDGAFGQKEKLFEDAGTTRERSEPAVAASGNIFQGRSASLCGPGSLSKHHDMPCDEDVESRGNKSTSISTRTDPVTKPSETETGVCVSSEGVYGTVTDTEVPISYLYEMQTIGGVDSTTVKTEILPTLEKKIVDSLLHDLFPEKCAETAIGKRSLQGILEVIGVSMNPLDYVTKNGKWIMTVSCATTITSLSKFLH